MKEYIERSEVHKMMVHLKKYAWASPRGTERRVTVDSDDVNFGVDRIPAADVVERKRGEWVHTTIEDDDWGGTYHRWTCSVCGGRVGVASAGANFCKWCGADMRSHHDSLCDQTGIEKCVVQEWISVKERLPEDDDLVLVYHKGLYSNFVGSISLVRWDGTYSMLCKTATHWMPPPEPPKED